MCSIDSSIRIDSQAKATQLKFICFVCCIQHTTTTTATAAIINKFPKQEIQIHKFHIVVVGSG